MPRCRSSPTSSFPSTRWSRCSRRSRKTLPSVTVRYGTEFLEFTEHRGSGHGAGSRRRRRYRDIDRALSRRLRRRRQPRSASSSASASPAKAICSNCGRRSIAATSSTSASRSARAATIMSPIHHTFLIVQDSTRHFTLHGVVEQDSDMVALFKETIAMPLPFETIHFGRWRQNLLVADSYGTEARVSRRRRRASRHPDRRPRHEHRLRRCHRSLVEARGDARRLGRAEPARSYGIERRQVGERNVAAARFASQGPAQMARHVAAEHPRRHPAGAATRADLARVADVEQRKTNEMLGAELGYRYVDSPLIAAEPGDGPSTISWTMCRAPGRACACPMSGSTTPPRCRTASAMATATPCCGLPARPMSEPRRGVRRARRALCGARSSRRPRIVVQLRRSGSAGRQGSPTADDPRHRERGSGGAVGRVLGAIFPGLGVSRSRPRSFCERCSCRRSIRSARSGS